MFLCGNGSSTHTHAHEFVSFRLSASSVFQKWFAFLKIVMATAEFRTFVKDDLPHVSCVLIRTGGAKIRVEGWDRCCPKTAGERIAEAMVSNAFEDLCVKNFGRFHSPYSIG